MPSAYNDLHREVRRVMARDGGIFLPNFPAAVGERRATMFGRRSMLSDRLSCGSPHYDSMSHGSIGSLGSLGLAVFWICGLDVFWICGLDIFGISRLAALWNSQLDVIWSN